MWRESYVENGQQEAHCISTGRKKLRMCVSYLWPTESRKCKMAVASDYLWTIILFAVLFSGVTIGFEQTSYTVEEGLVVEVCVLVTSGTLEREATVMLSNVNDEAVGKNKYS